MLGPCRDISVRMGWTCGWVGGHLLLLLLAVTRHTIATSQHQASSLEYLSESSDPQFSEIVTNIVLLSDSEGERVKREAGGSNETTKVVETSEGPDMSIAPGYGAINHSDEEGGSARGQPLDPLVDELDNRVDIDDDKINQNIGQKIHTEGISYGESNDTHKYYKKQFVPENKFSDFYRDLDTMNISGAFKGLVKEHSMLSQSYRRAATINLKFKFPFYGHEVENITIATGGFLYTGDYVHSWLAATQYIAPLMANFDTSNNLHAKIRYLDDGDKLVVEWKDVYLQEREAEGPFTFQVTLHKHGDIWFAYQKIPIEIISIKDDDHPVKVGLSDAYIIDRTIYFARRKTIYEYHRLNMKEMNIRNETAIVFSALETCNMHKDCTSCLATSSNKAELECRWCPVPGQSQGQLLGRCSDGTDRNRQDWLKRKCDVHNVSLASVCPLPGQVYPTHQEQDLYPYTPGHQGARIGDFSDQPLPGQSGSLNPGAIVGSVFTCMLLLTLLGWTGYAYFNPNTSSGRFLIKYRPGAWRWRQSGGRYTAASIHM